MNRLRHFFSELPDGAEREMDGRRHIRFALQYGIKDFDQICLLYLAKDQEAEVLDIHSPSGTELIYDVEVRRK